MTSLTGLLTCLIRAGLAVAVQQHIVVSPSSIATQQLVGLHATNYDSGLFTPVDLISPSGFTTLEHPAFPHHSVRVKQSRFCDESVRAYTGYIDVEARHLFFYFFESRRNPDKDDVILWTNGGPGSSSSVGLFMELGPCRVTNGNTTAWFRYSWNDRANIFFIDQPVGVGFSYADYGEHVNNTLDAGKDVAAFVVIFFEHFTKYRGRAFHLAGESYAGRYLPVFASAIYEQNAFLEEAGITPVNLTSVMIGNGGTDWQTLIPSWYDAQCADPIYPPVADIATCVRMKQMLPRCEKGLKESCFDRFDAIDCAAAADFCWEALASDYFSDRATRNPYDRSRPCLGNPDAADCYPEIRFIQSYLSGKEVQETIGVDPAVRGNFSGDSVSVNSAFMGGLDPYNFPATYYLAALLERGIRALIYVGSDDWVGNWIGNERMTMALEWHGKEVFRKQEMREWEVDGEVAGMTRNGGGLTFATIANAGHLAPYDQPVRSLTLANRWLAQEDL